VSAHCGFLGNERADEEAKKAAGLGPDDGAPKGGYPLRWLRVLFEVKDEPPSHASTLQVYGDGPFRRVQGASRREEVLLAQLRGGRSLLLEENSEKGPRDGLYVSTLWGG
jgi:hypothetical protein